MNRRSFLQGLGLGALGLYIRIAPSLVKAVPHVREQQPERLNVEGEGVFDDVWEFPVHDGGKRLWGKLDFRQAVPLYVEFEQ